MQASCSLGPGAKGVPQPAGQGPHQAGVTPWPQASRAGLWVQGKHRVQAIGQGHGDEAGPASRQENKPQARIRFSDGNQGQADPSDHQAGL